MANYVILSRVPPDALNYPNDFKSVAEIVSQKIKEACPGVVWQGSYATLGRFDFVDIVEAEDFEEVEKALMIMRSHGKAVTETMAARPWDEFLRGL